MSTLKVALGERSYDIAIEPGLLNGVLEASADLPLPDEIAILTNETVRPLYAEPLAEQLRTTVREYSFLRRPRVSNTKVLNGWAVPTTPWPSGVCAAVGP
jgi:3-dehydroquinate synthetase